MLFERACVTAKTASTAGDPAAKDLLEIPGFLKREE